MKIGILTQPLHTNYGGLLQAYALQTTLKRLGHDPLVLDRHYSQHKRLRTCLGWAKRITLKYAMGKGDVEVFPFRPSVEQVDTISRETNRLVLQYINKTAKLYSTHELKREVLRRNLDAYIVGSDQVWRSHYSPCITNYFLDFIEGIPSVKRIAYAASFGLDYWHFKAKATRQCRRLVQQFDAISVREDSGVDLCRQHLGVEAVHVVDPTLLLDPEDYRALVLENNERESAGDLMTYILDPCAEKAAVIQQISSVSGLRPFSVMPDIKLARETQDRIEECVFPSVTKWLRGYMDAKFVIADSFHGCVFAIIFNIPFVVIGNKKRGMARFVSLLRQFDLMNRLIGSSNELTDEFFYEPIDWDQVNQKRTDLKKNSINYLLRNL
jgi:hypothetical protein